MSTQTVLFDVRVTFLLPCRYTSDKNHDMISSMNIPTSPQAKTPEDHERFLEAMVRISLHAAGRERRDGNPKSIGELLAELTHFAQMTDFHQDMIWEEPKIGDTEGWNCLMGDLDKAYATSLNLDDFEARALALVKPHMGTRTSKDLEDLSTGRIFVGYGSSCLRADPHSPQGATEFHIANVLYPDSFLSVDGYLPRCLVELAEDSLEAGRTVLFTTSWLNSLEPWLRFFPQEWRDSLGEPIYDLGPHLGIWGQFVTARQTFNERSGASFRKTGRVPFPMRRAEIPAQDLAAHALGFKTFRSNASP